MQRIESFPPLVPPEPQLLILGSMPSVLSLQRQEYYGNPRNHFWALLAHLVGTKLPEAYPEKRQLLSSAGVALWDVLASCYRKGSSDATITDRKTNPIDDFLIQHRTLRAVAFNGREAERTYDRHFQRTDFPGLAYLILPSSSPIPTKNARNLQEKTEHWRVLLPYLR